MRTSQNYNVHLYWNSNFRVSFKDYNTGWTQNHSLISSSYKIKTYWTILINIGLQILHWHLAVRTFLNEHLPNRWIDHAGQNDEVFCKWPPRSPDLTVCDFSFGVRERQSLCTSTTRKRGWVAGMHHCSRQVGHACCAAESLVRARLSHRCLPSNNRGAHRVCVIPHETVWVYATVTTNFVRIFQ